MFLTCRKKAAVPDNSPSKHAMTKHFMKIENLLFPGYMVDNLSIIQYSHMIAKSQRAFWGLGAQINNSSQRACCVRTRTNSKQCRSIFFVVLLSGSFGGLTVFDVECNEDILKKKSFYTRGNFDAVPSGHIHLCYLVALKWLVTT